MFEDHFRRPRVCARMRANPLAELLESLADRLADRRHQPEVLQRYLQAAEHYGRWMGRRRNGNLVVDEQSIRTFVHLHLPRCRCRPPAPRHRQTVRAALVQLREVQQSIDPRGHDERESDHPHDALLREFDRHMRDAHGLAPTTRRYRLRYAREFLVHTYGQLAPQWSVLSPEGVVDFVRGYARRCSPATGQVVSSSIRCFLRFLRLRGLLAIDLAQAVPRVAHWRLAALPAILGDEDLERIIASCDRGTPVGIRDLGVVLCLADLGLRAQEVAGLQLKAVDWRRSVLHIETPKQRRGRLVPMTRRLAKALATYARVGRPQTLDRHLFVHHRAPLGAALHPCGIGSIIRRAAKRAGLEAGRIGPHRLRQTAASRMLGRGATLKQIADVLGHRSIDTTAIYAKVDLRALSDVALPWPGSGGGS